MSIMNRRNALLGWATWTAIKRIGKRKLRDAVPSPDVAKKLPFGRRKATSAAPVVEAVRARRFRRSKPKTEVAVETVKRRRMPAAVAFLAALGVGIVTYVRSRTGGGKGDDQ